MSEPADLPCIVRAADLAWAIGECRALIFQAKTIALSPDRAPADRAHWEAIVREGADRLYRLDATLHEGTRLAASDASLPPLPMPKPGERWRHYKGHDYRIHC